LSDSLGGNSKTALVVTIGPAKDHAEESVMSLQFAQRAMKVENAPVINKKIDYRILNMQLQSELDDCNDQLTKTQIKYMQALEKIEELTNENVTLKAQTGSAVADEQLDARIKQVQTAYEELLGRNNEEHRKLLEDVDKMMAEQEQQIEGMKREREDMQIRLGNYTE
jgi:hypothetical protein